MQKDDVIYRQAAILQLSHNKCGNDENDIAVQHDIETIKLLPSAQPVQKIGYWIPVHPLQADDEGAYLCSNCKTGDWDIKPTDKFCKFCGAKMQGVKKV